MTRLRRLIVLALALLTGAVLATAPAQAAPGTNGQRIKTNASVRTYLVYCGGRHYIPNPATYENLFVDWNGIRTISEADMNATTLGWDLSDGAHLAKSPDRPHTYLITRGEKLWISSEAVFNRYYFAWNKIRTVSADTLNSYPENCTLT